jgi:hypothetical protein
MKEPAKAGTQNFAFIKILPRINQKEKNNGDQCDR